MLISSVKYNYQYKGTLQNGIYMPTSPAPIQIIQIIPAPAQPPASQPAPQPTPQPAPQQAQTTQTAPSSTQTSSNFDQNSFTDSGVSYIKASASLLNQNYISLYLKYLATTSSIYQTKNLVGIYSSSQNTNSLLFRFFADNKYYNLV